MDAIEHAVESLVNVSSSGTIVADEHAASQVNNTTSTSTSTTATTFMDDVSQASALVQSDKVDDAIYLD
jgi:hypothetical protein